MIIGPFFELGRGSERGPGSRRREEEEGLKEGMKLGQRLSTKGV